MLAETGVHDLHRGHISEIESGKKNVCLPLLEVLAKGKVCREKPRSGFPFAVIEIRSRRTGLVNPEGETGKGCPGY